MKSFKKENKSNKVAMSFLVDKRHKKKLKMHCIENDIKQREWFIKQIDKL